MRNGTLFAFLKNAPDAVRISVRFGINVYMGFNGVQGNDDATMRCNDMRKRSQGFSGITFAIVASLVLAMGLVLSPAIGSASEPLEAGNMKANSSETTWLSIAVEWIDADNALNIRPTYIDVVITGTVQGGTQIEDKYITLGKTPTSPPNTYSDLIEVPAKDDNGRQISYTASIYSDWGIDSNWGTDWFPASNYELIPDSVYSWEKVSDNGVLTKFRCTLHPAPELMSPSKVSQAPIANDTTYDGAAQKLVQGGAAEGGEIMYALGADGTSAPSEESFSDKIPTGENAGSYYVWYYVKGDVIHHDTESSFVKATIAKQPLTITVYEQTYEYDGNPHGEGDTAYDDTEVIAKKVQVKGLAGTDELTSLVLDGAETKPGVYKGRIEVCGFGINNDPGAKDNYDVTLVPGDLTITDNTKKYTIKFVDEDGTELQSGKVAEGKMPEYTGKTPTKAATAQFTYAFKGWTPEVAKATADATYTATYSSTVREYTIKFVNDDGTELQSGKVAYGDKPAYKGETPAKAATAQFTYAFKGWSPELTKVTGDATYTATYTATPVPAKTGTLTFDLGGGTLNGQTGKITVVAKVGDTIKLPVAPTREGYTFKYWKGSQYAAGADYKVEGDHSFTAVWAKDASNSGSTGKKSSSPATGDGSGPLAAAFALTALGALLVLGACGMKRRSYRDPHSR